MYIPTTHTQKPTPVNRLDGSFNPYLCRRADPGERRQPLSHHQLVAPAQNRPPAAEVGLTAAVPAAPISASELRCSDRKRISRSPNRASPAIRTRPSPSASTAATTASTSLP